jgi:hypothetical protein
MSKKDPIANTAKAIEPFVNENVQLRFSTFVRNA